MDFSRLRRVNVRLKGERRKSANNQRLPFVRRFDRLQCADRRVSRVENSRF